MADFLDGLDDGDRPGSLIFMPWELERASICRRTGWRFTPHELDEMDVSEVTHPLYLLRVYDTLQQAGEDLEKLDKADLEMIDSINRAREQNGDN